MSWFKRKPWVNHYQKVIDQVRDNNWVLKEEEFEIPILLVSYRLKDGSVIQEYRKGIIIDIGSLSGRDILDKLSSITVEPDFELAVKDINKILKEKDILYSTLNVYYNRPNKELQRELELVRIITEKEQILVKFEDLDVVTFEEAASKKITHEILVKVEK